MKVLSFALLLVASMAFVLAGCSDNPASIPVVNDQASPSVSPAKQGPIVRSVTGSAHTIEPSTGKIFTYAVNAREYADGSFDGEYQLYVHGLDPFYNKLHGRVKSLKIWDGNKAVIGGVETISGFPGCFDALVVYDNGEGKNAPSPDMVAVWLYWEFDPNIAYETWDLRQIKWFRGS